MVNSKVLEVRNLLLHYSTVRGVVKAVDGINFEVSKGETLAIVGESGSGKSSTALAIMRILPRNVAAYGGEVWFKDLDIMKIDEEEFRRKVRVEGISMVFQGAMNSLNPVIRIEDQVAEPLIVNMKFKRDEAVSEAHEALKLVGLDPAIGRRYAHELSGGMKQRVLIAMSLVAKPSIIILDEPTSALDVITQANIMNLLKRLKEELGFTYLFITHDLGLASELADRVAVMYAGKIVEIGSCEDVYIHTKHPYTKMLLDSVPTLREDKHPAFIPGAPPDLVKPPTGCSFHPRCPFIVRGKCDVETPPMLYAGEGHNASCWLLEKESG
ncbi:MAG: ABC transporter ATP-binding protein [Candidatus Caldarchaeum sp.]|nr:ABC transporter ATP-binding protein [Candidatus Caldarchaeum sp.]MCS7137068.1 ABC transporter ATP-binding protein [Candidatus Caldarchaeum sp.]